MIIGCAKRILTGLEDWWYDHDRALQNLDRQEASINAVTSFWNEVSDFAIAHPEAFAPRDDNRPAWTEEG